MRVDGYAEDGYERVHEVFQGLVDDGRETGAGLSVWREGREVVRLNGGWSDTARGRPWSDDTLVQTYSVSKPFAALAALAATGGGVLDLDTPVARHRKGYGVRGKERTTLRHVLTHRAGLPRFPRAAEALDPLDDAGLLDSLANAEPEYAPGAGMGEHALTYGHLIDGVLRAAAGTTLGAVFREVVGPALGLDAWFGVPEHALARVADVEYARPDWPRAQPAADWLAVPDGPLDPALVNSEAWRGSVFGAVSLHASATGLARFLDGITDEDGPLRALLGREAHEEYLAPQATGYDEVFGTELTWTLGFLRDDAKIAKGGIGGSAVWRSLRHGHSCAYLTRRLDDHSRAAAIAAALSDDLSVVPVHSARA
ncbi:serine hydrolase domain-containing protein [Nocardiopsis eucommiae]|uniref:serine hydrolase domain-containing protein n=1 Tax=Nocardiopsis eucommiae TaxID=2831970 RepID=UPI003D72EC40